MKGNRYQIKNIYNLSFTFYNIEILFSKKYIEYLHTTFKYGLKTVTAFLLQVNEEWFVVMALVSACHL